MKRVFIKNKTEEDYKYNIDPNYINSINEDYYGKLPELVKCEGILNNIINRIRNTDDNIVLSPANQKDLKGVSKILENLFNIKELYIDVRTTYGITLYSNSRKSWMPVLMPNRAPDLGNDMQWSLPIYYLDNIFNLDKPVNDIIYTPTGFKFKSKKYMVYVVINASVFNDSDLTGGEILAFILSKIANNFYSGHVLFRMYYTLVFIPTLIVKYTFYWTGKLGDVPAGVLKMFGNKSTAAKVLTLILQLYETSMKYIKTGITAFYELSGAIHVLQGLLLGISAIPARFITTFISEDYSVKLYSDTFVTSYGYGPELISMDAKSYHMADPIKHVMRIHKIPNIKLLGDLIRIISNATFNITSRNFYIHNRGRLQTDALKKEIAKMDYNPKVKANMINDINAMNKVLESDFLEKNGYIIDLSKLDILKEFLTDKDVVERIKKLAMDNSK